MDWEKRLKELNGYNISFEIRQGYYHIALVYDKGWDILAPDNELIYVQEKDGVYHYIASTDDVKLDEIFGTIDATISYNMDLQKKLILFKQKTEELQQIFADKDFETLQTIEFTFGKKDETKKKSKTVTKEKTPKKSRTKKEKIKKDKPLEDVTEENVADNTPYYDEKDEIVTMDDNYMEELER